MNETLYVMAHGVVRLVWGLRLTTDLHQLVRSAMYVDSSTATPFFVKFIHAPFGTVSAGKRPVFF